jgi:filamentous hemagglutinin
MWDITVPGNNDHDFYVALGQRGSSTLAVLVHNECGPAIVDDGKWDYLFGWVKTGSHNAPRSAQNLSQLSRIGIQDTPEGRQILTDFFNEQVSGSDNIIREYADQYGSFQIRDGLLSGPGGFLHVESTWQVTDNGLRLTTIIPRGGQLWRFASSWCRMMMSSLRHWVWLPRPSTAQRLQGCFPSRQRQAMSYASRSMLPAALSPCSGPDRELA